MNFTTNYNLQKPLYSERYDIEVHNQNMDTIDLEMHNQKIKSNEMESNLSFHENDDTKHITYTDKTNWNDANSKKHSHSNKTILDNTTASYTTEEEEKLSMIEDEAEVNQNAFTIVKIEDTTVLAREKTDILTLVAGDNVVITPDSANNEISIAATIPSKTSELLNDSGFITLDDVDTNQNHMHQNKSVLDNITQSTLDKIDDIENMIGDIDLVLDSINRSII